MDENNNQVQDTQEQPTFEQPQFDQPVYEQPQTYYEPEQPQGGKGMAIASMVLGIVSIVVSCCYVYAAFVTGIIGLVLGIIALRKQAPGRGMAIAGIVTSIISLVLAIVLLIVGVAAVSYLANMGYDVNSLY